MGDFFKGLLDKAPDIIGKAGESPLALAALCVLVFGVVGVLLFRSAAGKLKLLALAMIAVLALVFVLTSNPKPPLPPQPRKSSPEKTALGNQAATKLADAARLYMAGPNDQARAAYGKALTLFKQEDSRLSHRPMCS